MGFGQSLAPRYKATRSGDIVDSPADTGLAQEVIGYGPGIIFEAGLARVIEW